MSGQVSESRQLGGTHAKQVGWKTAVFALRLRSGFWHKAAEGERTGIFLKVDYRHCCNIQTIETNTIKNHDSFSGLCAIKAAKPSSSCINPLNLFFSFYACLFSCQTWQGQAYGSQALNFHLSPPLPSPLLCLPPLPTSPNIFIQLNSPPKIHPASCALQMLFSLQAL